MRTIRTFALSGAAAVALLSGTTATATAATAPITTQAAVEHAAVTPVTLPGSGRTVHVAGMESAAYRASAEQQQAVVQVAADDEGKGPASPGGGNPPQSQDQEPPTRTNPQQPGVGLDDRQDPTQPPPGSNIQTQAGAGALSATAVGALLFGTLIFFWTKKGGLSKGHMIGCVVFGVLLAPTFVGPLVGQLMGSGASTFGNLWSGLG